MVMARDFWFQAREAQAVTSLRFVHCGPPESSRFCPRRGDILETVIEPYHDCAAIGSCSGDAATQRESRIEQGHIREAGLAEERFVLVG